MRRLKDRLTAKMKADFGAGKKRISHALKVTGFTEHILREKARDRMYTYAENIIAQIPEWKNAQDIRIERIGGGTNTSFLVYENDEKYILRISGENTRLLGIDREAEYAALVAVGSIGIGPEVVHYVLPKGHMVTRFIDGKILHWDELEEIQRIVAAVKRVHTLPAIEAAFSPFREVERWVKIAQSLHIAFPKNFDLLLKNMDAIESIERESNPPLLGLCHNDLFPTNVLDDGNIRIIDWEFAGIGDIFFDLATLANSLSSEKDEYILECYFGEVTSSHLSKLQRMRYMVVLWNAMWALVQSNLGYAYTTLAEELFARAEQML